MARRVERKNPNARRQCGQASPLEFRLQPVPLRALLEGDKLRLELQLAQKRTLRKWGRNLRRVKAEVSLDLGRYYVLPNILSQAPAFGVACCGVPHSLAESIQRCTEHGTL